MVIVALVAAWVISSCAAALFCGRALGVSRESDRWHLDRREIGNPRRLRGIEELAPRPETRAAA